MTNNSSSGKPLEKFFSFFEISIIKKDISQTWGHREIRMLIILLPLILMVILPVVYLLTVMLVSEDGNTISRAIINMLPAEYLRMDFRQQAFAAFTKLISPMLLILVAIVCSVCVATCNLIYERDNDTLETLMLSAMGYKSILKAKLSGAVLLSMIIILISFFTFFIVMMFGNILLSIPFFFNFEWLFLVCLFVPSLVCFGVLFITNIAPYLKSVNVALHMMGYLGLLFIMLFFLQFMGLLTINAGFWVLGAIIFLVLDIVLYNRAVRNFVPEKWLAYMHENNGSYHNRIGKAKE